jgi:site-specific DNA-methyltransferase (adenine-specific)
MSVQLFHGDCLDIMPALAPVDMVLCDLPYGVTQNVWDVCVPLQRLWAEYSRLSLGAVVLTGVQPFVSQIVTASPVKFRYEWVWEKEPSGNLNAKKRPMSAHESILVFSADTPPYYPQGLKPTLRKRGASDISKTANYGAQNSEGYTQRVTGYPTSIVSFAKDRNKVHPTQKPVALMEYLIRTYTNPGDTILDNCMGSGTTGVACVNTGRSFIGIEKDAGYFDVAKRRIEAAQSSVLEAAS